MSKNKNTKYFKYAIGEIILVMVGILLALQVNNWNENRIVADAEQLLLNDLLIEMIQNFDLLTEAQGYNNKSREASNKLLHIYHNKYVPKNKNEIDSLLTLAQWAWTYDPAMGALNAIKLSGHMNSVTNAELRKQIALYEDLTEDAQEESNLLREIIVNKYIPELSQYVNLIDRLKFLGAEYQILEGTKFSKDYDALFNDRSIENTLTYMHTWRVDERGEYDNLQQIMALFIAALEK